MDCWRLLTLEGFHKSAQHHGIYRNYETLRGRQQHGFHVSSTENEGEAVQISIVQTLVCTHQAILQTALHQNAEVAANAIAL
jgi:hypothetical protein